MSRSVEAKATPVVGEKRGIFRKSVYNVEITDGSGRKAHKIVVGEKGIEKAKKLGKITLWMQNN